MLPQAFLRRLKPRRSFSSSRSANHPLVAEVLEQRALLSADFAITPDALLLNGFTQVTDENLTIRESGSSYEFVLSEGVWNGSDGSGVTGSGTGVLSVDKSAVAGLAGGIDIDGSAISVDVALESADFSTLTGGLSVDGAGAATIADGESVVASSLSVSTFSIAVSGDIIGGGDAITLTAEQSVTFSGASLSTTSGAIHVAANWSGEPLSGTFVGVVLAGSSIATETGAIFIAGRGGDTNHGSHGVVMNTGAAITSTGSDAGSIAIYGDAGGTGTNHTDFGIYLLGTDSVPTTAIRSATGDVLINGVANDAEALGTGVFLSANALIQSTGQTADAATITLNGQGLKYGVRIGLSTVASSYGDVLIEGNSVTPYLSTIAVEISQDSVISSDGVGFEAARVTVIGTADFDQPMLSRADAIRIQNRSSVRSIDGDIVITGHGYGSHGSGVRLIGESEIVSTGSGVLAATITIIGFGGGADGGAGVDFQSSSGTEPLSGGQVRSVDGNIVITGTSFGLDERYSPGPGISLYESLVSASGSASIDLAGTSRMADAISVVNSLIKAFSGDVTIDGHAGDAGSSGRGVFLSESEISLSGTASVMLSGASLMGDGVTLNRSLVATTSGSLSISGVGSSSRFSRGVTLAYSSAALAEGTLRIEGSGTSGVELYSSSLQASRGAIEVHGTGMPSTSSSGGQIGVALWQETTITSTGTGADAATITIEGYAGSAMSAGAGGEGIYVAGAAGSAISSVEGDIRLYGDAYGSEFLAAFGVKFIQMDIISSGVGPNAANISITGVGADGGRGGGGVLVGGGQRATGIHTIDGDVSIHGDVDGGPGPDVAYHVLRGVEVFRSTIEAAGDGHVAITGVGPVGVGYSTGDAIWVRLGAEIRAGEGGIELHGTMRDRADRDYRGYGVAIEEDAIVATTNGGDIVLTGIGDNAADVFITSSVSTAGGGRLFINADSLRVTPTATIDVDAADVFIAPRTAGLGVTLGGDDTATALGLTDAELDRITAGRLIIGDAAAGDVLLVAPISQGSGYSSLVLITGGAIIDATTSESPLISVDELSVIADAFGANGDGDIDLAASAFTADLAGVLFAENTGALTLGSLSASQISIVVHGSLTIDATATLDVAKLDLDAAFTNAIEQALIRVDDPAAVIGTFVGRPEGSVIGTFNGRPVKITYAGGNGNDVVIFHDRSPLAVNDSFQLLEKGNVQGQLLTNDSDPDNDPLVVSAINNDPSAVGQMIALASGALLTVNADGTFTYDPNDAFIRLRRGETATETFTYTISDGIGGTASATVTLTIFGGGDEADLIGYFEGEWRVGVSNGATFDSSSWATWSDTNWTALKQGDFNGDGLTDVLGLLNGAWWVGISNGTTFVTTRWDRWSNLDWENVSVGDLDNDGDDDIVASYRGSWWVGLSNGSGFLPAQRWTGWSDKAWKHVSLADLDADGDVDLLGNFNGAWWASLSTGSGFETATRWGAWTNFVFEAVGTFDANGDGRADVYAFSRGHWHVRISDGSSFTISLRSEWRDGDWADAIAGDFNGDGRDDLAARFNGSWWISLSTASGGAGAASNWGTWNNIDWRDITVGDFDGDGRDDLAGRSKSGWWIACSTGNSFATSSWGAWDDVAWTSVAAVEASDPAVALPMASAKAAQTASAYDALALLWSSTEDDEFAAALLAV